MAFRSVQIVHFFASLTLAWLRTPATAQSSSLSSSDSSTYTYYSSSSISNTYYYSSTYCNSWSSPTTYPTAAICSSGQYSDSTGSCRSCPVGKYSPGSTTFCYDCFSGSFASTTNSNFCSSCPAGKFSATAASACSDCGLGTFNSGMGASSCSTCVGTGGIANVTGLTACMQCAAGEQAVTATKCGQCPVGKYPSGALCENCDPGTSTMSTGSSICDNCTAGRYAQYGSGCQPCAMGFFAPTNRSGSCLSCPVGRYTATPGATSCNPCPPGSRCLPGAPFPIQTSSIPVKTAPIPVNPQSAERARREEVMNDSIRSLLITGGAVFGSFGLIMTLYYKIEWLRTKMQCFTHLLRCSMTWADIDFLFVDQHHRPDGAAVLVKATPLGGVLTVLCIIALIVLGLFLGFTSFMVPRSTDVITPEYPAVTPAGLFRLTVKVTGNGALSLCAISNGLLASSETRNTYATNFPPSPDKVLSVGESFFGGIVEAKSEWEIDDGGSVTSVNTVDPKIPTECTMTWTCRKCRLTGTSANLHLRSSTRSCQMVNWANVSFEAPDFIQRSSDVADGTGFAFSSIILPGRNPETSLFYTDSFTQTPLSSAYSNVDAAKAAIVTINLCPVSIWQGTEDPEPRVAYQPTLGAVVTTGNIANFSNLQCPPPIYQSTFAAYGSNIDFVLQTTSYSIKTTMEKPTPYSVIVLLAAQATSVVAVFALFHKKIGQFFGLYPGSEELEKFAQQEASKQKATEVQREDGIEVGEIELQTTTDEKKDGLKMVAAISHNNPLFVERAKTLTSPAPLPTTIGGSTTVQQQTLASAKSVGDKVAPSSAPQQSISKQLQQQQRQDQFLKPSEESSPRSELSSGRTDAQIQAKSSVDSAKSSATSVNANTLPSNGLKMVAPSSAPQQSISKQLQQQQRQDQFLKPSEESSPRSELSSGRTDAQIQAKSSIDSAKSSSSSSASVNANTLPSIKQQISSQSSTQQPSSSSAKMPAIKLPSFRKPWPGQQPSSSFSPSSLPTPISPDRVASFSQLPSPSSVRSSTVTSSSHQRD